MQILGSHVSDWISFLPQIVEKLDYIFMIILAIDLIIYYQDPVIRHLIEPIILGIYVIFEVIPRRIFGFSTIAFLWENIKGAKPSHTLHTDEFDDTGQIGKSLE